MPLIGVFVGENYVNRQSVIEHNSSDGFISKDSRDEPGSIVILWICVFLLSENEIFAKHAT